MATHTLHLAAPRGFCAGVGGAVDKVALGHQVNGRPVVEAAFVLPVMMLMMLAMIHLGLVILGNSVGTNAARDGARVGAFADGQA